MSSRVFFVDRSPGGSVLARRKGQFWNAGINVYATGSAWHTCEAYPMINWRYEDIATVKPPAEVARRLAELEAEFAARCDDCSIPDASCQADSPPIARACFQSRCDSVYTQEFNPPARRQGQAVSKVSNASIVA